MSPFDLAKLSEEKGKLEEQMGVEGFWDDVENANKVNQRMKTILSKLEKYDKLSRRAEDLATLIEMAEEEEDESHADEIRPSVGTEGVDESDEEEEKERCRGIEGRGEIVIPRYVEKVGVIAAVRHEKEV